MLRKTYVGFLTLILFASLIPLMAGSVSSQDTNQTKILDFAWEQPAAETSLPDFGGWKIYKSATAGGPYTMAVNVPFVAANPNNSYTGSSSIVVPGGSETKLFFVATAYDKSGNESPYSNEISVTIDFKPPSTPINLKVTIRTTP
jgi:hypothetical protein